MGPLLRPPPVVHCLTWDQDVLPGLGGVLKQFPRTHCRLPHPPPLPARALGISQERSGPPCPPFICISKANFCPTCRETGTAVVPTSFAGVVVLQLLLLLRALLAFQGPVVQRDI